MRARLTERRPGATWSDRAIIIIASNRTSRDARLSTGNGKAIQGHRRNPRTSVFVLLAMTAPPDRKPL